VQSGQCWVIGSSQYLHMFVVSGVLVAAPYRATTNKVQGAGGGCQAPAIAGCGEYQWICAANPVAPMARNVSRITRAHTLKGPRTRARALCEVVGYGGRNRPRRPTLPRASRLRLPRAHRGTPTPPYAARRPRHHHRALNRPGARRAAPTAALVPWGMEPGAHRALCARAMRPRHAPARGRR
jgi:hypothetical protein